MRSEQKDDFGGRMIRFMYDVIINGITIANGLESAAAFAVAEKYLENHRDESVTLCVKRHDLKSVIECQ